MAVSLRLPDMENLPASDRQHISYSQITTMLACLRKWQFSYEQALELIEAPKALSLGKAFHRALELGDPIEGANTLDPECTVCEGEGQALANASIDSFGNVDMVRCTACDGTGRAPIHDQEQMDRLLVDKAIVACAAEAYFDQWPTRFRPGYFLGRDPGRLDGAREVEYLIRIRNPAEGGRYSNTFDLKGYADGVVDHGDHLELIEDKLVGQVTKDSVRRVALSRQVSLGCYALWRITGKPVRVVRFRFVRKPSIKPKQKESVAEYVQRLQGDYRERPEFYIHEEATYRSSDNLLETERELWAWAEMLREAKRQQFFPRDTDRCHDFGSCQFLPLCFGDSDAMSLYRKKDR